jgi:hypothetical protein
MDDNERGSSLAAYSFIILFQPQSSTSANQPKALVGIGVYSEHVSNKIVVIRINKQLEGNISK